LTLGAGLGGQSAAYGANAGKSLLVGGIGAAETQQKGSQYDPLAGLLTGLAGSQQLSQGLQNYFNPPYVQNQNAFNYGQTTGFSDNRPVTLF